LLETHLILQQPGSGATAALYEAFGEYGVSASHLNVVMELGLQESTKAAVRSGVGVTIISRLGVIEELARRVLVEVPIQGMALRRDFYAVYRRASPLTNLARTFLEYVCRTTDETVRQIREGSI
jgi:DNA-binding transcriptional LysR family regulator